MKFHLAMPSHRANRRCISGFTLVEVLVATVFMVVVIPVALNGMRVASLAGESAQRKMVACRVANTSLNRLRVENQLINGSQRGVVTEDGIPYSWSQQTTFWTGDPLSRLYVSTVTVHYDVAGRHCSVELSTLAPPPTQ
jgi:Tfp pilus assembly protein PilV